MARFKYLGEPENNEGVHWGQTKMIRVPRKNGTTQDLTPIPPATQFVKGADIGYNITDERSVRVMRADSRYQEIV